MKESHLLMGGATSLNNINLKANKPVWGKECTHCMARVFANVPKELLSMKKKVLEGFAINVLCKKLFSL